ncbi:PepSY domain-containing protein [Pseudomaricurvus alkylphenolicus]|jgi:hypothetical protein|uniref:PepSY domain-containing protein n=1 Tax=Pseudomaricurvus alkylphenolicus TaxID=1306991 RepID=UPI001F105359|nr:PepSY domain-containing protein [Pseudomaricurvus alkylphenolicus]
MNVHQPAPDPKVHLARKIRRNRLRPFFWRWHKRAGLAAALIVLLVAITGIALNHTSELQLGKASVRQAWLLEHYGVELPSLRSYKVNGHWLSGDDSNYLYMDAHQVAYCNGRLVGGALNEGLLVAACEQELLLLTDDGEVVERLGATYGLPVPLSAIGTCGESLCVQSGQSWLQADFQQLVWTPLAAQQLLPQPGAESPLPADIRARLLSEQIGSPLSWERVLLDLHSGRIFGTGGVLIVDAAAILLVFLAFSGFWLWYRGPKRDR